MISRNSGPVPTTARLAMSNIAWQKGEDATVADALARLGVAGVEIAPTKVWDEPLSIPASEVSRYRRFWEGRGFRVVALQSLLFGREDIHIFGTPGERRRATIHLEGMIRLAARLGARVLVFGSPKNRSIAGRSAAEVSEIAISFFGELGRAADAAGVVFCIEPNPPAYGCDYLMTSGEVVALVAEVGSVGLGVHLDAAGMVLSGEPLPRALEEALPVLRHFHVSEPFLAPPATGAVPHVALAHALVAAEYAEWISIEMKATKPEGNVDAVIRAVKTTAEHYGEWLRVNRP